MKNITKALIAARRQMGKLVKDAKNPHFKSAYATLQACHDVAVPALADAGIAVVEYSEHTESGTVLHLDLVHVDSGEQITSAFPLVCKDHNNPQQLGSAQTYARRYLIMAAAGLTPEGDDGNGASRYEQHSAKHDPDHPDSPEWEAKARAAYKECFARFESDPTVTDAKVAAK